MGLSSNLITEFAKVTAGDKPKKTESTAMGTAVDYGGKIYVRLDGSDQLTPVTTTTGMKAGDRVMVTIKDHSAIVTGNTSSPSTSQGDLEDAKEEIGNKITEVEILIADKVDTIEFNAEKARIDELVADNVTIKEKLTATEADIGDLEADNVTINKKLTATDAEIENLKVTKLDVDIADLKYATIENLEATNADIHNLTADYGDFKQLATNIFNAQQADIDDLEANKLSAEQADLKYANIDFANIGKAAIENFFSKSGMIGDLVVGDGTITGTLIGVTIKGDLIEGGTVVADKLVLKGSDGLYYKLNTDGETVGAEQTEYNSLNGSVITAKSITAEKVNVNDLVAFDATIGGFKITESSIYSGVKESPNNTTRGIYFGDDGQFAIGDQTNFFKYIKDTDGSYKLLISANSLKFTTSDKTVEESLGEAITKTIEEFYLSDSPTSLVGGIWSATQPTWTSGKYIWRRTQVTNGNGEVSYTPSETGVCITGNTGADGQDGTDGQDGVGISDTSVSYNKSSSGTTPPESGWSPSIPLIDDGEYLWTRTVVSYTDHSSTTMYAVGGKGTAGENGQTLYTWIKYADTASGGGMSDSPTGKKYIGIAYNKATPTESDVSTEYSWSLIKGEDGQDGTSVTVTSTDVTYQVSTSGTTEPSGSWVSQIPTVPSGQYLWTKTEVHYSDGQSTTSYSVSRNGVDGSNGSDGQDGTSVTIVSQEVRYKTSTSGTTPPTGIWYTYIPSTSAGQYLWTRTVVTYSDDTTTTSYSVSRNGQNGADGQDGKDGVGVLAIDVQYYLSTSSTALIGGSWSSDAPTWVDGKYIWSKTVTTLTNETTKESEPACITGGKGPSGSDGSDGDPGTSVSSITEEYYLSTSKTEPTGGSWVSEPPVWTTGNYLWTRSKIVYSNPTSTEYTTPVCDSSWEAVNEIKPDIDNAQQSASDAMQAVQDTQESINEDLADLSGKIDGQDETLDNLTEQITTVTESINELEQTAEGWSFNFQQIQTEITQIGDEVTTQYSEQLKYIKFIDGEIWLGKDPDPGEDDFKVVISNERIRFLQNNVEVAYVSNAQLYITNAQVTTNLVIGDFSFTPRTNGNLTLRFNK